MRNVPALLMSLLVALAVGASPLLAQDGHIVDRSELRSSVTKGAASEDANRATVLRVLQRSEVREIADRMGVDVSTAEDAVATLDGVELERLSDRARAVETALAGGQSITISTTVIIIALLVVILILVAD
jgi:predicted transcriptional regulator